MDEDTIWYAGMPRPKRRCVKWWFSFPRKRHSTSTLFGPCLLWGNGWMDQDALDTEVDLGPGHIVSDGACTAAPPPSSTYVYCGKTVAHLSYYWALCYITEKLTWPLKIKWTRHIRKWLKIPTRRRKIFKSELKKKLRRRRRVVKKSQSQSKKFDAIDVPLYPSPKGGGAPSPIFGPFLLWPNGWMHQDVTWYGCRP